MSKIFVISDTHFYHSNIIKYCDRPFPTTEQMNTALIKNWNNTVGKNDKVFHLGDVGLGNSEKVGAIIRNLNGRKYLIRGNHDHFRDEVYRDMGFEFVSPYPIVWNDKFIFSHAPLMTVNVSPFFNIYGHVHNDNSWVDNLCSKCVSVERINYTPLLIYNTDTREYFNIPKNI